MILRRLLNGFHLRKSVKVEVYLRSGQVVKFRCRNWEAKGEAPLHGSGLKSYSFKDIKGVTVWFDISEIVAIKGDSF